PDCGSQRRRAIHHQQRGNHQPRLRAHHREARHPRRRLRVRGVDRVTTTDGAASPRPTDRPARSEKTLIFRMLAVLLIPLMNVLGKYILIDAHKVPKTGAFVLAPNHFSEIDPVVIGVAMWKVGRMPRYLAKASVFKNPIVGWFL